MRYRRTYVLNKSRNLCFDLNDILFMVHLVLHPHGIAPTFFKLDSWSPGYYIHQGNKSDKVRTIVRKRLSFNTKRFHTFFRDGRNSVWVQFHVYYFLCLQSTSIQSTKILLLPTKCEIIFVTFKKW